MMINNSENDINNHTLRFSEEVDVNVYNVALGDHPDVNDGPALSLGWNYARRTSTLHDRPSKCVEFISKNVREELLKEDGVTDAEMKAAIMEGRRTRVNRINSCNQCRRIAKASKGYTVTAVVKRDSAKPTLKNTASPRIAAKKQHKATTVKRCCAVQKQSPEESNKTQNNNGLTPASKQQKRKWSNKRVFSWHTHSKTCPTEKV